jgi:hypothetical protein
MLYYSHTTYNKHRLILGMEKKGQKKGRKCQMNNTTKIKKQRSKKYTPQKNGEKNDLDRHTTKKG